MSLPQQVMIKLSGEILMGDDTHGLNQQSLSKIIKEIKDITAKGIKVIITVGGGNFFRGLSGQSSTIDRTSADQIGMMATVMNGLALRSSFITLGLSAQILSMCGIDKVAEDYSIAKAKAIMDKGDILILTGGTGRAFFTTDTAAIVSALETGCDMVVKATKVDGVYDSDPKQNKDAKFLASISYNDIIDHKLRVMDHTAAILARDGNIPIIVCKIGDNNLLSALMGKTKHTYIS